MLRLGAVCLLVATTLTAADTELPKPIFYLPFDGSAAAALAGGGRTPAELGANDAILALVDSGRKRFVAGKVGQAYDAEQAPLVFRCPGNFRPDEGACSVWLSPLFRGSDTSLYCTFFGAADWGMLYKYQDQTSLTFGTAKPDKDLYYDCGVPGIQSWAPGQWHHVVVSWSRQENARRMYVDGQPAARAPFPFHREIKAGPLFVGSGCTLYPGHTAHAVLDEFAIWDRPLSDGQVQSLYRLGQDGQPLAQVEPQTAAVGARDLQIPAGAALPALPPAPPQEPTRPSPTRLRTSLDGWWQFRAAPEPLPSLPGDGWGRSLVPGYWTAPESTFGPDGKPVRGTWDSVALTELPVAYYHRRFESAPGTPGGRVLLEFGGVEGLAAIYLNGDLLAWLPHWESAAYDVTDRLRAGQANELTLRLHTRTGSPSAGVYGSVAVLQTPAAVLRDVAVFPSVTDSTVRLSCDLYSTGAPAAARLEFEIASEGSQGPAEKRFAQPFRLEPGAAADAADPDVYARRQRLECTFAWPQPHLWTYDDPWRYRVTGRLLVGDRLVDEAPPAVFGFREFGKRGGDFLLNGVPTHLRGHQIDLGWPDQFSRVRELKDAGLNSFELSGPTSCDWYTGRPYQRELFEAILEYADTHGLIALPVLPDASVLKDRIFEPEVARLYQRRVDKHMRQYGNHPSVGMWYMSFNLAGYNWYLAPSKMDGSYKPDDEGFGRKERYSLAAQKLVQQLDPRPLYHHACGNFGDVFSMNCYIGPNSPLQEREEWPSRWAETKPFPLLACEHCLMLIPYWFRPRQFPLSVVYAGEPIFDEITALYLGQRAYGLLTPPLFDLYDLGRPPRADRMRRLISNHPGYQEVKTVLARRSLRAWRTYGVSGVVFNAENWDFKAEDGTPLPVMKAMARYFGDTDLYLAGPPGDWPSKDHGFSVGEEVRKQIVLLSDLTRDLPVAVAWRLEDRAGRVYASGRADAVAQAGVPTFLPIAFKAPAVGARTGFRLTAGPEAAGDTRFQPDAVDLQVFPQPPPWPSGAGQVLLYDPRGDTRAGLAKAGIETQPFTDASRLPPVGVLVVGRQAYGPEFLALAAKTGLEAAVNTGLSLLVLEQTAPSVLGLTLTETSTRSAFPADPTSPLLQGLEPEDLADWRGTSDLVEAYPDAPPESQRQWPRRSFKWGNRGIVATFVYRKPHLGPFAPVLESGFDLTDSPLLQARVGQGRVVLCQLDVSGRCGTDPAATRFVRNALDWLRHGPGTPARTCAATTAAAREFLAPFAVTVTTGPLQPPAQTGAVMAVDGAGLAAAQIADLLQAADRGATVLLLPDLTADAATGFGLALEHRRLFAGRVQPHPLLAGIGDGDLYLKQWTELDCVRPGNGWTVLVEPGLLAVKPQGQGQLVACRLPVATLGQTRARVKATRFWSLLLGNLGVQRDTDHSFLAPSASPYLANDWEEMPPYINW